MVVIRMRPVDLLLLRGVVFSNSYWSHTIVVPHSSIKSGPFFVDLVTAGRRALSSSRPLVAGGLTKLSRIVHFASIATRTRALTAALV